MLTRMLTIRIQPSKIKRFSASLVGSIPIIRSNNTAPGRCRGLYYWSFFRFANMLKKIVPYDIIE